MESYSTFRLEIKEPSSLSPGTNYWKPVGAIEGSLELALRWLKADFNIYRERPKIVYRVVKTTHYEPTTTEVVAPTLR